MVAKGYSQIARVDHFETFSIVIKPTTIRIVLTLVMSKKWPIKQLDVHNVFLHGELREDVFMVQLSTLLTQIIRLMCISCKRLFMVLSKHHGLGILNLVPH